MVRKKTVYVASDAREFSTDKGLLYHERELLENTFGPKLDRARQDFAFGSIGPREKLAIMEALFPKASDGNFKAKEFTQIIQEARLLKKALDAYVDALEFLEKEEED